MNDIQSGKSAAPVNQNVAEGMPPLSVLANVRQTDDGVGDIRRKVPDAMEVFFAWERLRLLYNAILLALTMGLALHAGFSPLITVVFIGEAFMANLCFSAGSVGEGYLAVCGIPRLWARWGVFSVGLLLTVVSVLDHVPRMLERIGDR